MAFGDQVQNIPAPETSGFPTIVSANEPPNPYQGMTWMDSDTNSLSVYHSGDWIKVNGSAADTDSSSFIGAISEGILTKVSGELVVSRISPGVFDVTIPNNAALIINIPDDMTWGEAVNPPVNRRRIIVRNSATIGRPLADPAKILIRGFL